MIIKKLRLPTRDAELDYFLSGENTLGMPTYPDACEPFNIFSKKRLYSLDFHNVTVFCGGSNSEKNLMLSVIASKLGIKQMPKGMSDRCLGDYLKMCYVEYEDSISNGMPKVCLITKEQSRIYMDKMYAQLPYTTRWSIVDFYQDIFKTNTLYLLEEPEIGMSLSEQEEFQEILYNCAKKKKDQFIITTNSHVLLGMNRALIYDFDEYVIKPVKWHKSNIAQRHIKYYKKLKEEHRAK